MDIIKETAEWVRLARGTHETDINLQIQQLELIRQQQSQEIDEIIKWLKEGDRKMLLPTFATTSSMDSISYQYSIFHHQNLKKHTKR